MKRFVILLTSVLLAQTTQSDVSRLLGSARSDLWVFGVNTDPKDKSAEVQVRSWKLPKERWLWTLDPVPSTVLYSERPGEWDWQHGLAFQLKMDEGRFYLSKYDDHSGFSANWGMGTREDGTYFNRGTILRYEDGHLKLVPDALKRARVDYGLRETQNFLGMVGDKVFYFDSAQGDRIFFFEKGRPDQRFEVAIPIHPLWSKSWKLASVDQVFAGENPDEILVYVWAKNTAWMSAKPRRDASGVSVDLKTAKPAGGSQIHRIIPFRRPQVTRREERTRPLVARGVSWAYQMTREP